MSGIPWRKRSRNTHRARALGPTPETVPQSEGIAATLTTVTVRDYHDSPATKPVSPGKRHHTERYHVPNLAIVRWTNAKSGYVGFLTGRGYLSTEIERILRDGTSAATIRGLWRRWGLPLTETGGRRCSVVPVALPTAVRTKLSKRAKAVGLPPDEWLRRVIVSVIDDDLYQAVTDDRFDPKPKSASTT